MNYEPDDMDDVEENPYGCPKTDYFEEMLEKADYLRDKLKDEAWERSIEASEKRFALEKELKKEQQHD